MRTPNLLLLVLAALALAIGASAETPAEPTATPAGEPTETATAGEPTAMPTAGEPIATATAGEPTAPATAGEASATATADEPTATAAAPAEVTTPDIPANADAEAMAGATPEAASAEEAVAATATPLGPVGYDAEGRAGRIHVVVPGDTLWDISEAYLGTPWVWPSVWTANEGIENPHLILPGDHIWISATEMRRITAEEAESLLSGVPPQTGDLPPAAFDESAPGGRGVMDFPIFRYSDVGGVGFVTAAAFEGSASIVDSAVPRVWLADPDEVIIGFGASEVSVGDRFEIFRPGVRVIHPETRELFGYETKMLGWLEVQAVHAETATAAIRLSRREIRRGDHLLPLLPRSPEIAVQPPPQVEGQVVHTPGNRMQMAGNDLVFLDHGTRDGLVVGSPIEVYRPLGEGLDAVKGETLALPDEVVAKLLVVEATPDASAAVVTHSEGEINRGDRFRGSASLR